MESFNCIEQRMQLAQSTEGGIGKMINNLSSVRAKQTEKSIIEFVNSCQCSSCCLKCNSNSTNPNGYRRDDVIIVGSCLVFGLVNSESSGELSAKLQTRYAVFTQRQCTLCITVRHFLCHTQTYMQEVIEALIFGFRNQRRNLYWEFHRCSPSSQFPYTCFV